MTGKKHIFLYAFVAALFLTLTGPSLFSDGMFMDGLLYATISKNMANGLGTFWSPQLSNGIYPVFYEHPPLAFGLQGLWFWVFGDSIFVERFYSLTTYVLVGILIVLIWKEITKSIKTGWIPLLLWVTVSNVPWACANNMLENTMAIFITLSAFLYIKSLKRNNYLLVFLSGIVLSLALLTKGFVALYIWTFPFFFWIIFKEGFIKTCINTFILVFATALPIYLLYTFSSEAATNMSTYFNNQVVGSIQGVITVKSRFAIIGQFFQQIIAPVFIGILVVAINYKRKNSFSEPNANAKMAILFFLVVLSGVLPITISMKQRGFYILTVFPFFAISLGYYLYPFFIKIIDAVSAKQYATFKFITYLLVIISLTLSVMQINRIGRDVNTVELSYTTIKHIGKNKTINICPSMFTDWSLHGYFARNGNVSLDADTNKIHNFLLVKGNCEGLEYSEYNELEIGLKEYKIFEKKQLQKSVETEN